MSPGYSQPEALELASRTQTLKQSSIQRLLLELLGQVLVEETIL